MEVQKVNSNLMSVSFLRIKITIRYQNIVMFYTSCRISILLNKINKFINKNFFVLFHVEESNERV